MKEIDHSNEYLVYSRKSTDEPNNQKNSLDYQVGETLRLARTESLPIVKGSIESYYTDGIIREKHSGYKTEGINFNDTGQVVFDIGRPKFQRVMQDLMQKKYKGLIVLCWDRVSRNEQDGLVVKRLIDDFKADIRFVQANYEDSAAGALHRDIDGTFAQHFSREVSQKTRAGLQKIREKGYCSYVSPIGFLDQGSASKIFDPERAQIVLQIFELYATGEWSFSQLARWARQEGLTTKPMRPRRSREEILSGEEDWKEKVPRPITSKSIENMLSNPFYIGKLRHKGTVIDGIHPILVEAGLFYKVQAALAKRRTSVHHPDKSFATYRGIIKCACSRSYSPYEQKGQIYLRARCQETCTNCNPNLTNDEVHAYVGTLLEKIAFSDEELREIESKSHKELNKAASERDKRREAVQRQIDRIDTDLDYLKKERITLLRTKAMSAEEYAGEVARLENESRDARSAFGEIHESEDEMLKCILTFSELVKRASLYYKYALDIEKHQIITQAFTELRFSNNEFSFIAKDGYSALFLRHDQKKNDLAMQDRFSGSTSWNALELLLRLIVAT